ncbi:uncharacterized protein O3C94_017714 [Discoglossus pictus]
MANPTFLMTSAEPPTTFWTNNKDNSTTGWVTAEITSIPTHITEIINTTKQESGQNQSLIIGLAAGIPSCVVVILLIVLIVVLIRMRVCPLQSRTPPHDVSPPNRDAMRIDIPSIPRASINGILIVNPYDNDYETILPNFSTYETTMPGTRR